jgi:hypothetical protein
MKSRSSKDGLELVKGTKGQHWDAEGDVMISRVRDLVKYRRLVNTQVWCLQGVLAEAHSCALGAKFVNSGVSGVLQPSCPSDTP